MSRESTVSTTAYRQGPTMVPGTWLETVAVELRLTGLEWRVVALVLAMQPITAWNLSKRLRRKYAHVKRVVRELVRWRILVTSPEGLRFRFEPTQWGPPPVPASPLRGRPEPPKSAQVGSAAEPEEMIFTG